MSGAKTKGDFEISRAVTRIHAGVLALIFGVLGGLGLFVMTVWLLLKGGPHVGAHLQLLSQYLYGYRVTWLGSIIGLAYGLLLGGAIGWLIGNIYNRIVGFRLS
ncbi:MAG: hypothetical protein HY699_12695 [Deltaproteobacteria bacterium]|nr:hypothetical protein [Deltaproteobacteria bacterium]